jgi:hypothetical protein
MALYQYWGGSLPAKQAPPPLTPPRFAAAPLPTANGGGGHHRQRSVAKPPPCQDSESDSEWNAPPAAKTDMHRRFRWNQTRSGSTLSSPSWSLLTTPFATVGRAVAVAAFCSSVVAVLISLLAVWFFYSSTILDLYSDQQFITTTSVVRTRFRTPPQSPQSSESSSPNGAFEPMRDELIRHRQPRSPQQLDSIPILLSHVAEEEDHRHHYLAEEDEPLQHPRRPQSPTFRLPLTMLQQGTNITSRSRTRAGTPGMEDKVASDDDDDVKGAPHPQVAVRMLGYRLRFPPTRHALSSILTRVSIPALVAHVIPEQVGASSLGRWCFPNGLDANVSFSFLTFSLVDNLLHF